ncbi:MAG: nucleotidyltransferase domain-containing protein, partial [Calditrichaeota bacterium]|nr:nucleotidyltransferase domain-containing protein [Calditrichota bacterium]
LQEILKRLKAIKPVKIILFGSVAQKIESKDSDIDLLVVLDSDKIAQTYEEKLKNKMFVRKAIFDLSKKIPIDLIVYTKAEFEILAKTDSSFINEINNNGKIIYEKADFELAENGAR